MGNIINNSLESETSFPANYLEKMCQKRMVINLCNNQELLSLIMNCYFAEHIYRRLDIRKGEAYGRVQTKANELLSKLGDIGVFKDKILEFLWPMSYKILLWKFVYAPSINKAFMQHFNWTDRGSVDSKRTALKLIKNKLIPIEKRFLLACSLCLNEEIEQLWKDMSFADRRNLWTDYEDATLSGLRLFWTEKLRGKNEERVIIFEKALDCAANIGSVEAIQYLFSRLSEYEKRDIAVICCDKICERFARGIFGRNKLLEEEESEFGYFIYSKMTEAEQNNFLNSHSCVALLYLLYPPGQELFLKFLRETIRNISLSGILLIIIFILGKINLDTFKDYDYCELFIGLWEIIPEDSKEQVIDSRIMDQYFCDFISRDFTFVLIEKTYQESNEQEKERPDSKNDKWKLLLFFIKKKIVTTESLMKDRRFLLYSLRLDENETETCAALERLKTFVNNNQKPK